MAAGYTVGQLIGPYQIQKYLNGGGMGDVYLAWDSARGQQVALKLLKPEATRDPKLVERFRREALVTSQLRHPHLVQVYAVGQTPGGQHYMAMAYVDGGSLDDWLQQYRERNQLMPVNEALYLARRIAEAMAYAHEHGVIHRDLKPGNILLRRTGEPVVTDLGIAAIAGASSLTGTLDSLGTPHYMAPEQIRKGEADARADIYAMGVMLYEMLTGRYPFEAENAWAILNMKLSEMPTPVTAYRADIPAAVAQIIHTCLQPNAAARYPSAQALAQALDGYAYGMGQPEVVRTATPQPNPSLPMATQSPIGRKTTLPFLYVLLGIVAVGLFIIFAISSPPRAAPITPTTIPIAAATITTFPTSTPLQRPLTQTPAPTLTPPPKGLVVEANWLLVFQERQLDGLCADADVRNTDTIVAQNDIVYVLSDYDRPRSVMTRMSDGSCQLVDFIKIQAISNSEIEGWVLKSFVQLVGSGNIPAIAPSLAGTSTPTNFLIGQPIAISPMCDGNDHFFTTGNFLVLDWEWDGQWQDGYLWEIHIFEPKTPESDVNLVDYYDIKEQEALKESTENEWEFSLLPEAFHEGQNTVNYQWEVALVSGERTLVVSSPGCFTIVDSQTPPGQALAITSSPAPPAGARQVSQPQLIFPRCDDTDHFYMPSDSVPFEWRWDGTLGAGDYLELRIGSDADSSLPGRGSVNMNDRVAGFTNQWLYRMPVATFHPGGTIVKYAWQIAHLDVSGQVLSLSPRGCLTVTADIQPNATSTPHPTIPPLPSPVSTIPPPPYPVPTIPPPPYPIPTPVPTSPFPYP